MPPPTSTRVVCGLIIAAQPVALALLVVAELVELIGEPADAACLDAPLEGGLELMVGPALAAGAFAEGVVGQHPVAAQDVDELVDLGVGAGAAWPLAALHPAGSSQSGGANTLAGVQLAVPAAATGRSVPPAVAPPPGNPRFPLLDALRAVAALSVLVHHVTEAQGPPARLSVADFAIHLNAGVAVFFVISGFVIYRPFLVHRHRGGPAIRTLAYARRRALRIVPAYWLALTLLAIYPGLTFTAGAWRYYLFGQVYSTRTLFGGLSPAWTLCGEVTFYAALPLIALAAGRAFGRGRSWLRLELLALGACVLASWALHVWLDRLPPASAIEHFNLAYTLPGVFDWFALGMALAALSVAGRLPNVPPGAAWALAAAVFAACVVLPQQEPLLHPLFGLLGVLIVLPALVPAGDSRVQRLLALRPLALLGLISYGIYLWNQPIVLDLATHGARSFPILLVVTLAITLTVAALSYRLVEAPLLRLKRGPRQDRRVRASVQR